MPVQQELLHSGKAEQAQRHMEARARHTSQRRLALLDILSTKIAISADLPILFIA